MDKIIEILMSNNDTSKLLGCQLLISHLERDCGYPMILLESITNVVNIMKATWKLEIPTEVEIDELEQTGPNYQYPFMFKFGNVQILFVYVQFSQRSLHPKLNHIPIKTVSGKVDVHYTGETKYWKYLESVLHKATGNLTQTSGRPIFVYADLADRLNIYRNDRYLHLLIEWEIVNELIPHFGEELKQHWYQFRLKETIETLYYKFDELKYKEEVEKLQKSDGEKV
jgi:hypothetical protein